MIIQRLEISAVTGGDTGCHLAWPKEGLQGGKGEWRGGFLGTQIAIYLGVLGNPLGWEGCWPAD